MRWEVGFLKTNMPIRVREDKLGIVSNPLISCPQCGSTRALKTEASPLEDKMNSVLEELEIARAKIMPQSNGDKHREIDAENKLVLI